MSWIPYMVEEDEEWEKIVNKVSKSVVKLNTRAARTFDTFPAGRNGGTGFVVDKNLGIILTNRHVAKNGPVIAEAIFYNKKVIKAHPLYVDPVHDFAFFRYDPDEVQSIDYEEIPLVPQAAEARTEICIVSYLGFCKYEVSLLLFLDRDAPRYKNAFLNDFNTFYMQAAALTKGGSSGSPVVDIEGNAIALNVGSDNETGDACFLPLERVVRALDCIQRGNQDSSQNKYWEAVIPRGTLQTTFLHKGFPEARKLGLTPEVRKMVRAVSKDETGVLAVDSMVPEGPANNSLEFGDILVKVNGEVITQFWHLENVLDDNVDQEVALEILRGGISLNFNLKVQNLHSIIPSRFLEIGGSIIQPLSYQMARSLNTKCGQVYVTVPGYMLSRAGVPCHSIIRKVADKAISNLHDLILVLSELFCGARVPLEYEDLHSRCTKSVFIIVDELQCYPTPQIYTRNDRGGYWKKEGAAIGRKRAYSTYNKESPKLLASQESAQHVDDRGQAADNASVVERVKNSLVAFKAYSPLKCMTDGMNSLYSSGTGVVVYQSESWGLVAIDRVPISTYDVMLLFSVYPNEILGEVVFFHPIYHYSLVAYNRSSLGEGASLVRSADVIPVTEPGLKKGDIVYVVSLIGNDLQPVSKIASVTSSLSIVQILTGHLATKYFSGVLCDEPRVSAMLCDRRGFVHAIWGRFTNEKHDHGVPMYAVSEVVSKITRAEGVSLIKGIRRPLPLLRVLGVGFCPISHSKARILGLNEYWIQVLKAKDPVRCEVLSVQGHMPGCHGAHQLQQDDMVLKINGETITCHQDVEKARQGLNEKGNGSLKMTICRPLPAIKGKHTEAPPVFDVIVNTDLRDGSDITRFMSWCGYIVQEPPEVFKQLGGVFVNSCRNGSPAQGIGYPGPKLLVKVNWNNISNLDSFRQTIKGLHHGDLVHVRALILDGRGRHEDFTILMDELYWPSWEIRFDSSKGAWRHFEMTNT